MPSNLVKISYRLWVRPTTISSPKRPIGRLFFLVTGVILLSFSVWLVEKRDNLPFFSGGQDLTIVPGTQLPSQNYAFDKLGLTNGLRLLVTDEKDKPVTGLKVIVYEVVDPFIGNAITFYTTTDGGVLTYLDSGNYTIRMVANEHKAYDFMDFSVKPGEVVWVRVVMHSGNFTYKLTSSNP